MRSRRDPTSLGLASPQRSCLRSARVALVVGGLALLACEPPSAGEGPPGEAPTEIAFAEIAVGGNSACGLSAEGDGVCWGRYAAPDTTLPVAVMTDERFRSLAVGGTTRCALTTAGAAWCWGGNSGGQLGAGGTSFSGWDPVEVSGGHTFISLAQGVGFHRCAIRDDRTAWCWGWNDTGQLGHEQSVEYEPTPVQVSVGNLVGRELLLDEIAVGPEHSCGIRTDGTAVCWGLNTSGQRGDGTTSPSSGPTVVAGGHTFTAIVAAGSAPNIGFSCALDPDGRAYCWGRNTAGALGDGTTDDHLVPTPVASDERFVRLSAAGATACALTAAGDAFCWGRGMGAGAAETTGSVLAPTLISGGHRFTRISTGTHATCAVTIDADAYCWGRSTNGLLGNGQRNFESPVPQKVGGE